MSIWDEWKKQQIQKREDARPSPPPKNRQAEKRLITAQELEKLERMRKEVTPQSGSMDKRFIRNFDDADAQTMITERQGWFIEVLWYKYRRQLGHNDPEPIGYSYYRIYDNKP